MRRILVLAVIALLATAGVALAGRGDGSSVPLAEPGNSVAPAGDAAAAVKVRFGVLRRAASGEPPAVDVTYARSVGLNLAEARQVRAGVFVAPGAGTLCTVRESGAAVCAPQAAAGKDFLVEGTCESVSVSGLVPDGVDSATIRKQNASTQSVPVVNNFLDATVPVKASGDVPTAVEYGGVSYALPVAEAC